MTCTSRTSNHAYKQFRRLPLKFTECHELLSYFVLLTFNWRDNSSRFLQPFCRQLISHCWTHFNTYVDIVASLISYNDSMALPLFENSPYKSMHVTFSLTHNFLKKCIYTGCDFIIFDNILTFPFPWDYCTKSYIRHGKFSFYFFNCLG